jgi:hypothetical protein
LIGTSVYQLNAENLEEYVCHVVDATVKSGIARQMEAFKSGFNEVFALQFCGSLLMLVTGGGFHLHYDCLVWLYSGNALILEHKKMPCVSVVTFWHALEVQILPESKAVIM